MRWILWLYHRRLSWWHRSQGDKRLVSAERHFRLAQAHDQSADALYRLDDGAAG